VVLPELGLTGYSCADLFYQRSLLDAATNSLLQLANLTSSLNILIVVGLPFSFAGRIYNCAALVLNGEILGIVPKQHIPNSREYYEKRWFSSGSGVSTGKIDISDRTTVFGCNLLFCDRHSKLVLGIEICEDLWAVIPTSNHLCLAGANLIVNPSASNEVLGKAQYRRSLVQQQSARTVCAYAYASAGPGESSTDLVFSGHCLIAENGVLLSESERFQTNGSIIFADLDLDRLEHDRFLNSSFSCSPRSDFEAVMFSIGVTRPMKTLLRPNPRHPFVPADPKSREEM
jgi:NAD+ synthase (glutamine-hydrolysing)